MPSEDQHEASEFPLHLDRYHLPEPKWAFPNARVNFYASDSEPNVFDGVDRRCRVRMAEHQRRAGTNAELATKLD